MSFIIIHGRGKLSLYISKMLIQNYRLLKNVGIDFDESLTLFVGKNNTGKTSIMSIMEVLVSDSKTLLFDDYPLECRKTLYNAVKDYWNSSEKDRVEIFQKTVPITAFTLTIDYSDDPKSYGELSNFILDLNTDCTTAIINVSFDVALDVSETLEHCKTEFDILMSNKENQGSPDEDLCLAQAVREFFPNLFQLNISAVDQSHPEDIAFKSKNDLKKLFCLRTIKAERSLDESETSPLNPIGQILSKLFSSDVEEVEDSLKPAIETLQTIIHSANFNIENRVNAKLNDIVSTMTPFGYPDGEDLELKANTTLELEKRIIDGTELAYVSGDVGEMLPESHNGLGYKNLIKISMELHDFIRTVKADRTKIPVLFIEEPEAHMHPQLQSTFVEFLEDFLKDAAEGQTVQVMMTTHSPHVANTVPFSKVRYIRRYKTHVEYKNLGTFPAHGFNDEEQQQRVEFLQKYMKLSYCDLYFCDKSILVEGASERLLIPDMIRKCEEKGIFGEKSLASQYYTIIEVGGAYAHLFYDFVDYLGVPTLIITDIDYVNESGKACQKEDAKRSSNAAINRWCHDVFNISVSSGISIDKVLELGADYLKRENGIRRIEFQAEENGFLPRSLEEAIINVNRGLFSKSADEILNFVEEGEKKTDFAIKLLYDPQYHDYAVPSYIRDGLIWLCGKSRFPEGEEPATMHKRKYKKSKNM